MKNRVLLDYCDTKFRRITGVRLETFTKMVDILRAAYESKHKKRGRKPKLLIEDMLLASLEYWREYRTYAHIAASYGIHESNMYRIVRWVEDVLISDGTFPLPGKKALLNDESDYDVVLLDATETPIERPQKNSASGTRAKRNATP
jgi:hypothetical protein